MTTRLLVPLDGSALGERAVPYATTLARASGGRLILLHLSPPLAAAGQPEAERDAAFELDSVAEELRNGGLDVETVTDRAYHADLGGGILEAARERHVHLIVMSTHGRGGLGRWLYGSTADQVLRGAEVPVLLVPAACERDWTERPVARILVPLDGSALAEEVLPPAAELADALGAQLLLARIVGLHGRHYPAGKGPATPVYEDELAEARRYLGDLATELSSLARTVETHADLGSPPSMIPAVARERQADLIAMATHGRGGVARFALGSVATGVLQRAEVPLLLVRPVALRQAEPEPPETAAGEARGYSAGAPGPG